MKEIENGRGTLYDANAVDACVRLFTVGKFESDVENDLPARLPHRTPRLSPPILHELLLQPRCASLQRLWPRFRLTYAGWGMDSCLDMALTPEAGQQTGNWGWGWWGVLWGDRILVVEMLGHSLRYPEPQVLNWHSPCDDNRARVPHRLFHGLIW